MTIHSCLRTLLLVALAGAWPRVAAAQPAAPLIIHLDGVDAVFGAGLPTSLHDLALPATATAGERLEIGFTLYGPTPDGQDVDRGSQVDARRAIAYLDIAGLPGFQHVRFLTPGTDLASDYGNVELARTVSIYQPALVTTLTVTITLPDGRGGTFTRPITIQPAADSDSDGLPDRWEEVFGFDPQSAAGDDGPDADPDGDGLTNLQEYQGRSHPRGRYVQYFAEGASNDFFETRLDERPLGQAAAVILERYYGEDGGIDASVFTFEAGLVGKHATPLAGYPSTGAYGTIVESDQPFVARRVTRVGLSPADGRGNRNAYDVTESQGAAAPAQHWYFAEGATAPFSLYYLLLNPADTEASVTVSYVFSGDRAIQRRTYTVPPHSRKTIDVGAEGDPVAHAEIGAALDSDTPIVAERSMYLSHPGAPFKAGASATAIGTLSPTWYFAEGATGYFSTYLLVMNPNGTAADLEVRYLLDSGAVVTRVHSVGAGQRLTIDVAGEDPALRAATFAIAVTSRNGVPVAAERAMWWGASAATGGLWLDGHATAGAVAPALRWEGTYDVNVASYTLIANPLEDEASVLVNGTRGVTVPAHSRVTLEQPVWTVESTGASPVPVVVEYSTYDTYYASGYSFSGVPWSQGRNTVLTPIVPNPQE